MNKSSSTYKKLVILLSILIPGLVALLYFLPKGIDAGEEVYILPKINAVINGLTFIVLVAAFIAIRNKNVARHKALMMTSLFLSALFLILYVAYHSMAESTPYGGEGFLKGLYFFILISHILLAIVMVPLVLITFVRAFSEKFDKHKKIARITLPIWLYVSLTGVIVYLMISPYY